MIEDNECWKDLYATHSDALVGARSASKKYDVNMRPYECPFCDGYHLTKMSRKEYKKAIKKRTRLD